MRIRDKIFEEGSKPREVLRKINNLVHCITLTNIKKLLKAIKAQGIRQTFRNIRNGVNEGRLVHGKILSV